MALRLTGSAIEVQRCGKLGVHLPLVDGTFVNYSIFPDKPVPAMKYNQTSLQKLERLLSEAGYILRYERGNFQSGYCILEEKKVVVLNRFLQTEGKVQTLIDLIPLVNLNIDKLTDESQKLYLSLTAAVQTGESS